MRTQQRQGGKKLKKDGTTIFNDRRNQIDIASTAGIAGAFFEHASQQ